MSLRSTVLKLAAAIALTAAVAAAYLCLWPVPAEPVAWQAPAPPGYVGPHAPNTRLANLHRIDIGTEFGPEHIAFGPDGKLYAAMTSGHLLRMDADGGQRELVANTGGRVLGFDFDTQGNLVAADAMKGLLTIARDGKVDVLADRVAPNDPIRYANSVVVAPDGTIYFTDASGRFAPSAWGGTYEASVLDILEQAATGRVLAHDPRSHETRVVAHGFSFANGIALSADGGALFVSETGRYRIWKLDAAARGVDVQQASPQARVLLDNLPGYPDNLMRGREGRIWVGLFKPRNPAADGLATSPFLRKVLLRLPRSWLPLGQPYGHVFAIDENGRVVQDLQDATGAYPETTGATETAERLYIHSLHAPTIGWVAMSTPAPVQSQEKTRMKNIVLVHGAWADGSGWQRVHDLLRAKGYAVSIVQNPLTSLAADVAAVQRVLARQKGPALLVGHSYGGVVITEAGNAPNVAGLVYVAAFAPDAGESVASLIEGGGPPPVQPSADGYLFFDANVFPQAFAQDVPPAQAAFLAAAQVPPAAAAFEAKVTQPAWKTHRSWYVLSTDDRIIPPPAQRKMAERAKASIKEVRASHAVYISQPEAVAEAIDAAARASDQ